MLLKNIFTGFNQHTARQSDCVTQSMFNVHCAATVDHNYMEAMASAASNGSLNNIQIS